MLPEPAGFTDMDLSRMLSGRLHSAHDISKQVFVHTENMSIYKHYNIMDGLVCETRKKTKKQKKKKNNKKT